MPSPRGSLPRRAYGSLVAFSRPHSPWWLVGYGLAWYVAFDTGAEIGILVTPDGVTIGVIGGILAGLMQWRLLRRYVRRSIVWLPAMIASAIVGGITGVKAGLFAYQNQMSTTAAYVIGASVAGATFGLLSAIALLYFVGQQRNTVTPTEA